MVMQQMMVHKDLKVMSSTTNFINTLQAYGIVLEKVIGCSTAMVAYYETDILDRLYEWMAILESEYQNQPQIRLTELIIILTYIWRVTNNHFMALLRNPAMQPPVPTYGQIQEHLVQGTMLHLMALPDQVVIKTFITTSSSRGHAGSSIPGTISTNVNALTGSSSSSGTPPRPAPPLEWAAASQIHSMLPTISTKFYRTHHGMQQVPNNVLAYGSRQPFLQGRPAKPQSGSGDGGQWSRLHLSCLRPERLMLPELW
jgi:hypothetical protein